MGEAGGVKSHKDIWTIYQKTNKKENLSYHDQE